MPTVLVAHAHPLFRETLRNAAAHALPTATIREAESITALYALIARESDADLLLLDLNMPGAHGFSARRTGGDLPSSCAQSSSERASTCVTSPSSATTVNTIGRQHTLQSSTYC